VKSEALRFLSTEKTVSVSFCFLLLSFSARPKPAVSLCVLTCVTAGKLRMHTLCIVLFGPVPRNYSYSYHSVFSRVSPQPNE